MALGDAAMYALVLGRLGRVEMAVTSNLNINFLVKPKPVGPAGRGAHLASEPAPGGVRGFALFGGQRGRIGGACNGDLCVAALSYWVNQAQRKSPAEPGFFN